LNNYRIQVVGTSGSGKSTLARSLSRRLNLEHLELDSIYHQPGWTPLPDDEFKAQLSEFVSKSNWVIDGNYSRLRQIMDVRVTHLIWLDYPRWFVMLRLIRRTLWRVISRKKLWNGNREAVTNLFKANAEQNIILWARNTHASNRWRYQQLFGELPAVEKTRIGSPLQVNRFLEFLVD
jgi:adenylate kinase family enzyme